MVSAPGQIKQTKNELGSDERRLDIVKKMKTDLIILSREKGGFSIKEKLYLNIVK